MKHVLRLAAACGLGALCALAGDTETWSSIEAGVSLSSRVSLAVQGLFRTRDGFGEFYQGRVGPILRFSVAPRLGLIGGYYYRDTLDLSGRWGDSQRGFGGVEVPLHSGRWTAQARVVAERFFGDERADYTRLREMVRVSSRRKVAPFASVELFQLRQGYAFTRPAGGVRFRIRTNTALEVAYMYEAYRQFAGVNRNAVVTSLRFNFGKHEMNGGAPK